jgi:hypothetical protein
VRFDGDARNLVYGTYLGGGGGSVSAAECAYGIAVDSYHNAYITGSTPSANFPTLTAFQTAFGGGSLDAFVAKLSSGGALLASSYLGGSGSDIGTAIRVDSSRRSYVAGYTASINFPTLAAVQVALGGVYDGFFARVDVNGNVLNYSSYIGGSGTDIVLGSALSSGDWFLVGATSSTNFPLQGAFQSGNAGSNDAFVTKLGLAEN